MNLRQAAQQALEALEYIHTETSAYEDELIHAAITALRAALAEPEQAPMHYYRGDEQGNLKRTDIHFQQPEQEPQTTHWEGCEAVHPECRKTEQEPDGISWLKRDSGYFTAPTPRKPLTDEEMRECAQAMNAEPLAEGWPELIKFARAIERAHGITGEQHE